MLIAFLLTAVVWTSPSPVIYVCDPGKTPKGAPSNCQRLPIHVIFKFRF